jgi:hypothetical protein
MTTYRQYSLFLMIGLVFIVSAPLHAQWATIARKIKSMHTGQTDVATVMIDARTFRVYGALIDTLTSDPKFKVISRNNADRQVEFTNGTYTVSMKVDSLANGLSQITVAASHLENSPKQATGIAIDAITGVCHKVGIKCTVDKP